MRYLFLILSSVSLRAQNNKIVYLVSTPRSTSTAMFRMFENRDDFVGFHSPTVPVFQRKHIPHICKTWFKEGAYESYDEIEKSIFKEQEDRHIIFKDVSCTNYEYLMNADDLINNPGVHFIFLVNDPYWITDSFYRMNGVALEIYSRIAGVKQIYEMYQHVKAKSPNTVQLILTDELKQNPEAVIRRVFDKIDIAFSHQSLSWESLGVGFDGSAWHDPQTRARIQHYHGAAINSTHFKASSKKVVPCRDEMFASAKTDTDREILMRAYECHRSYYGLFLEEQGQQVK